MKLKSLIAAIMLLFCSLVTGQDWALVRSAVVRVDCADGIGTGTVVHVCDDGSAYVLTAKHVAVVNSARITWSDGHSAVGSVIQRGERYDTAVIRVQARPGALSIDVADDYAPQGTTAISVGYGGQSGPVNRLQLIYWKSRVAGYQPYADATTSICIEGPYARSGDSGGPILNEQTQLIGVTIAYGPRYTIGPHVGPVRNLLRAVLPHGIVASVDRARIAQGRAGYG